MRYPTLAFFEAEFKDLDDIVSVEAVERVALIGLWTREAVRVKQGCYGLSPVPEFYLKNRRRRWPRVISSLLTFRDAPLAPSGKEHAEVEQWLVRVSSIATNSSA